MIRPVDPVEYLAMLLLKQEQIAATQLMQHRALEQIKSLLRAQIVSERFENAEAGRI